MGAALGLVSRAHFSHREFLPASTESRDGQLPKTVLIPVTAPVWPQDSSLRTLLQGLAGRPFAGTCTLKALPTSSPSLAQVRGRQFCRV